jgi:hypothetical protein
MAREIKTEILIHASTQSVWSILTNFDDYPNWNPFIKSLEGNIEVGQKFKAHIQPPGSKGMTFKPRVLVFDQNKTFSWLGHLFIKGLFDGEHIFELVDQGDGRTLLIQKEIFTGILVPVFDRMMRENTINGFEAMNEKVKELAEVNTH